MRSALLIFFNYLPAGSAMYVSTLHGHLLPCGNKGCCNVIARLQIEVSLYKGERQYGIVFSLRKQNSESVLQLYFRAWYAAGMWRQKNVESRT